MPVRKHLWSIARMFLPVVGFALTCLGAYLVSMQAESRSLWRLIPAYILMALGFLAVLVGVFWTVCHSMKSKMYRRGGEEHIQIYTIESRPRSFPPSYEESQYSQANDNPSDIVVDVDGVDVLILAPPLYSADSSEAPDCRWSWERPPRYSQVEKAQQAQEE
ncbi:transmembrane protein 252-like [Cheilinus undulatus]|uniref:transmembrane protein 252-like n=1 Tax=Cheilinus undulatus TaxID=241271 RepID=UPI001BD46830|nr:transmembrane protein 252-like [Cheilinus undulatus]